MKKKLVLFILGILLTISLIYSISNNSIQSPHPNMPEISQTIKSNAKDKIEKPINPTDLIYQNPEIQAEIKKDLISIEDIYKLAKKKGIDVEVSEKGIKTKPIITEHIVIENAFSDNDWSGIENDLLMAFDSDPTTITRDDEKVIEIWRKRNTEN
jgi:hypothetical protein